MDPSIPFSTHGFQGVMLNHILRIQDSIQETGIQISSGKRVQDPYSDPMISSQYKSLKNQEKSLEHFAARRSSARDRMYQEELVLSSIIEIMTNLMEFFIGLGNVSLNNNDYVSLLVELQENKKSLLNLANSQDGNGNFIFAGSDSRNKPYVYDRRAGCIVYQGSLKSVRKRVDTCRKMVVSHAGYKVFTLPAIENRNQHFHVESEPNVFNSVDTVIHTLKLNLINHDVYFSQQLRFTLAKSMQSLEKCYNNMLLIRAELGIQMKELDELDSNGQNLKQKNQISINELVNTNYTQAISDFKLQQVALQASFMSFKTAMDLQSSFLHIR